MGAQGEKPPAIFFAPLEKCVGHSLKLLDTVRAIIDLEPKIRTAEENLILLT